MVRQVGPTIGADPVTVALGTDDGAQTRLPIERCRHMATRDHLYSVVASLQPVVYGVSADEMDKPTPCTEFDVRVRRQPHARHHRGHAPGGRLGAPGP